MKTAKAQRRLFLRGALGALGTVVISGCDRLSEAGWFQHVLSTGEGLSRVAHRALVPPHAMAQEFGEADLSPHFRSNGTSNPEDAQYQTLAANGFKDWKLTVDGLVEHPLQLSLADLRAMPKRTQITRHDCVEGWSAIGKWTGVPLGRVLEMARPRPNVRYAVFHCADPMDGPGSAAYYESIDMEDAFHPQTILAYALNDQALPVANGAPLRLRVERQLGYKHAKYLNRIELVVSLDGIRGGKGGYWEDGYGYQWYAGI
ncbi:MAG TPA: molybdopterin-binding protein [Noviherbaspirillum sp.]|uniref:molybdopterin-binding protein n=1 Tax=Noviherbaspirillum sp. TaxID=1926288 RepID=UPI002B474E75|nr:molybdopterin-binding protein [Noviherbaspirillum sp.]HJV84170.1 molybdopterin-binding protein [Noviherbaspirillum sp.]